MQTKEDSVIPEMEPIPIEVIADVARFRPRTNREVLMALVHRTHDVYDDLTRDADLSAPGMANELLPNL